MKGFALSLHIFIRTCSFCFAVTQCPTSTSIYLYVSYTYTCKEILYGTVGEFFNNCISEIRRRNQIIGKLSINGSVQFIRISEIRSSGLPFIPNPRYLDCFIRWVVTGSTSSNENPCYSNITGNWGVSFNNSTVNWSRNCIGSVNTIPDDFPQSPICPCVVQCRVRKDFLRRRC